MNPEPPSPLELASLEELWAEIASRTDGALLVTSFEETASLERHRVSYTGSVAVGLGLCRIAQMEVEGRYWGARERALPEPEDDEEEGPFP